MIKLHDESGSTAHLDPPPSQATRQQTRISALENERAELTMKLNILALKLGESVRFLRMNKTIEKKARSLINEIMTIDAWLTDRTHVMRAVVTAAQERLKVWRMLLDTEDDVVQGHLRTCHEEATAEENEALRALAVLNKEKIDGE